MTRSICPKTVSLKTKIAVTVFVYIYICIFQNPIAGSLSLGDVASTCGSSISSLNELDKKVIYHFMRSMNLYLILIDTLHTYESWGV